MPTGKYKHHKHQGFQKGQIIKNRGKYKHHKHQLFQKGQIIKNHYHPWGSENHSWKGGVCQNKQYVSWSKNKRNRLKGAIRKELGSHTFGDWELLKKQYNYTCPCCHKSEPNIKLTEDHIIPLSKGGSDLIENIQPLCLRCNMSKHTKIIKY